jgi:hypothetical protein
MSYVPAGQLIVLSACADLGLKAKQIKHTAAINHPDLAFI